MNAIRNGTVVALAMLLGGCASGWIEQEDVGSAARDAVRAQTLHPAPASSPQGLDGPAARASIDNYQKAMSTPHSEQGGGGVSGGSAPLVSISTGAQP